MSNPNTGFYKQGLLVLAIIFIVAGAILLYIDSQVAEFPPYVAIVVLAIGIIFLIAWALILIWREAANR